MDSASNASWPTSSRSGAKTRMRCSPLMATSAAIPPPKAAQIARGRNLDGAAVSRSRSGHHAEATPRAEARRRLGRRQAPNQTSHHIRRVVVRLAEMNDLLGAARPDLAPQIAKLVDDRGAIEHDDAPARPRRQAEQVKIARRQRRQLVADPMASKAAHRPATTVIVADHVPTPVSLSQRAQISVTASGLNGGGVCTT